MDSGNPDKSRNPLSRYLEKKKLQRKQGHIISDLITFINMNVEARPIIPTQQQDKSATTKDAKAKQSKRDDLHKRAQPASTNTKSKQDKSTITEDPKTKPDKKEDKPAMTNEEAAIVLQRIWRTRQLANDFFSEQSRDVYWQMLDRQNPELSESESNLLAKMMFGKTIAAVRKDTPKNASDFDFPTEQHPEWPTNAYYHRDDKLSGKLIDDVAKLYLTNPDHSKFLYVPIIIVNNASIEDVLKNFLTEDQRKFVTIHKKTHETIGVIEIDKKASSDILPKIQSAGLIASPWEIAKFNAKHKGQKETEDIVDETKDKEALEDEIAETTDIGDQKTKFTVDDVKDVNEENTDAHTEPIISGIELDAEQDIDNKSTEDDTEFGDTERDIRGKLSDKSNSGESKKQVDKLSLTESAIERLLPKFPDTIKGLKESQLLVELSKIAVDPSNPNKLLAACLYRMITGLPDGEYNKETLQRMALFLNFGVKFYKMNYERFAFSVYAVTHELSLLIDDAMKKGVKVTDYQGFKKSIEKDVISSFGLSSDPNKRCKTIAAPAMAGTHAFMIAMDLAKKMNLPADREPTIQITGSAYFEFKKFIPENHRDEDGLADIYHISAGPIVNPNGVTPGTDINIFIKSKLLQGKDKPPKPVTIVVDVTTGLHKNLKLDDDIKKLVENGDISIICYESYQKFGLAHTDQVQGGVVYGICSDTTFQPTVISDFETNAKNDLENHLDMAVASFMHEHSGQYIERIKEQHFKNGALFNSFFKDTPDYVTKEIHYDEMLRDLNELYFFLITENPALKKAADATIVTRDSFGHFATSLSSISTIDRLSPNASDKIDTLITITQLYLSSNFTRNQLFDLVSSLLSKRTSATDPFPKDQEIVFVGLLMALKNLSRSPPALTILEEYKLLYSISFLSDSLAGRNATQTLRALLDTSKSNPSTHSQFFKQDNDFLNKNALLKYIQSKPSHEEIMIVMNELSKLSQLKASSSDQYIHKAVIAIHLSGLWNYKQPNSNKSFRKFSFSKNKNVCMAIVALKNLNLLDKDIAFALIQDNKISKNLATAILLIKEAKDSNGKTLLTQDIVKEILANSPTLANVICTQAKEKKPVTQEFLQGLKSDIKISL
jgi:hypothetical protein